MKRIGARPLIGLPPAPLTVGDRVVLIHGHTVWEVADVSDPDHVGLVSRPRGVHRAISWRNVGDGRLVRFNGGAILIEEDHHEQ
jgi:hypothetical protein